MESGISKEMEAVPEERYDNKDNDDNEFEL
jgi:hypothetical protein